MNAPHHDHDPHETLEASGGEPAASPRDRARRLFIHGLLAFLHHDKPLAQERRVQRVVQALQTDAGTASRWTLRPLRAFTGIAAAGVLAASAFLLWPATTSATGMIESSLAAAEQAGDRRYELSIFGPAGKRVEDGPTGTIDVRSSDRYVVQFKTPRGQLAFGRDDTGEWTLRPDGMVDRLNAQRGRPRWLDSGESSLFLGSVESVLETLKTEYATNRVEAAPLPGRSDLCDRLTATRRSIGGPEPLRIELWFDRSTKLVNRMEMHWPEMKFPGPGPDPDGRRVEMNGPGAPERPDGPAREGDGPRHPERRDGPPPPPGGEADARPRPERFDGPDGRGPRPPLPPLPDGRGRARMEGRPEGGPPPPHQPPLGPRRPGMPGPGGMHERGPGGPPPLPPRFMDGPPDFRQGPGQPGRGPGLLGGAVPPPPPSKVVIEMVDAAPAFEGNWFAPERHATKPPAPAAAGPAGTPR